MSPHDDTPEEIYYETQEGSAGKPQRMDEEAALARADEPDTLSEEALDERQNDIGRRRRQGGPPLTRRETADLAEADQAPPDVPPTECEEPPVQP